MQYFIRPKDTNLVSDDPLSTSTLNAEEIQVVQDYEDEYTTRSGTASHWRDPNKRREAHPSDPLPPGSWTNPPTKTVKSGFPKGR